MAKDGVLRKATSTYVADVCEATGHKPIITGSTTPTSFKCNCGKFTWTRTADGRSDLQEIYKKFDDWNGNSGGNSRLAWYGQCRAQGMSHQEAIADTFNHYEFWCRTNWPIRNIPLPE